MLGKAITLLDGLLAEEPAAEEPLYQKARRTSALARAHRDQGKRVESEKLVAVSNGILTKLAADHPENPYYQYQLALALWQKAELQSDLSQQDEAVASMHASMNMLSELVDRNDIDGSQRKQIQVSMAYLTGDLGHRLEEARRRDDALAAFEAATKRWKDIASTYGEDDITADAITWCQRRVEELRNP